MKSYVGGGLKTIIYGPDESRDMTYVTGFRTQKPVHRSGDIERVVVARNVQIYGGSLTVKLMKNGSFTGQERVYTSADPYSYQYHSWVLTSPVFVDIGDTVGLCIVSSSDFDKGLAANVDFHAGIEVTS